MAKKRVHTIPKLDLHGIKHEEVEVMVENFVIFSDRLPLHIVTGKSDKMIKIVTDLLDSHGFIYEVGDFFNKGYIKVVR